MDGGVGAVMAKHAADFTMLLTKLEAAKLLRISVKTFERKVQPLVPRVKIGSKVLFDREDLQRWVDTQKVGESAGTAEPASTSSGSDTMASVKRSARADEILRKLRRKRRASTPRLFPVGGRRT